MPPRFSEAFSAAIGSRAGVADPRALFGTEPDVEARKSAHRLDDAVERGDYQTVLDALSYAPDLVGDRPLTAPLARRLTTAVVCERRSRTEADLRALCALWDLACDDAFTLAAVNDAERAALLTLSATVLPAGEADLRARAAESVYRHLADGLADRLGGLTAAETLARLLGARRSARLGQALTDRGAGVDDLLARAPWREQLLALCVPGVSEHNSDALAARAQEAFDGALWRALDRSAASTVTPAD